MILKFLAGFIVLGLALGCGVKGIPQPPSIPQQSEIQRPQLSKTLPTPSPTAKPKLKLQPKQESQDE